MNNEFSKPNWGNVKDTYNLRLINSENINFQNLEELFQKVIESNCQGQTISKTFIALFQKWLDTPQLPLREEAYVLLSNCFLAEKPGVAGSSLAINAEILWKNLFCSKPTQRLSIPEDGMNDKVLYIMYVYNPCLVFSTLQSTAFWLVPISKV